MPEYQPAVIYCRIASEIDGSLDAQETACRTFAERRGYDVLEVFTDITSGRSRLRAGLEDLLAYLSAHKGTLVIIEDVPRLARNVSLFVELREQIWQAGGRLQTPALVFADNPRDSIIENLMAAVAQYHGGEND